VYSSQKISRIIKPRGVSRAGRHRERERERDEKGIPNFNWKPKKKRPLGRQVWMRVKGKVEAQRVVRGRGSYIF
jgi:hypothetical protein